MSDRDITVVSQEDLDFIKIGRSKLSYYKRLGVGIYPNDVFAEVAETFLFLKECFPSISETKLNCNSKERKQYMLNLNSKPSPDSILTFNYIRMKCHSGRLRYRDVDQRTLAGAKFLNLDDCIRIFQPANLLDEKVNIFLLYSLFCSIFEQMESTDRGSQN
jgi:hypothetical protein